jgi:hypothetical protein
LIFGNAAELVPPEAPPPDAAPPAPEPEPDFSDAVSHAAKSKSAAKTLMNRRAIIFFPFVGKPGINYPLLSWLRTNMKYQQSLRSRKLLNLKRLMAVTIRHNELG